MLAGTDNFMMPNQFVVRRLIGAAKRVDDAKEQWDCSRQSREPMKAASDLLR
jgi:hypothetical protein